MISAIYRNDKARSRQVQKAGRALHTQSAVMLKGIRHGCNQQLTPANKHKHELKHLHQVKGGTHIHLKSHKYDLGHNTGPFFHSQRVCDLLPTTKGSHSLPPTPQRFFSPPTPSFFHVLIVPTVSSGRGREVKNGGSERGPLLSKPQGFT